MIRHFVSVLLFLSYCCTQSGAFVGPVRPTALLSVAPRKVNNFLSAPKFRVSTILQDAHDSVEQSDDALTVDDDQLFNIKTTFALVGGQSILVGVAVAAALIVGTPNFGLGPGVNFSVEALVNGALWVVPLGVFAYVLDLLEERVPALQDVTKATQRSVLALFGGKWKPIFAVATASALGLAAGIGEEMLFRGVLQYELATRFGEFASVAVTSIIFGALHAVTPLYALLASLASVYFGWLYTSSGNLAVPIATHALYDIAALLYCHWIVTQMTEDEQMAIAEWQGPMDPN
jgi:membrane protease YdiL (CAAX protease family)